MKSATRYTGVAAAGVFLAFHLPYLPRTLEDLDSINFALGIRDFDVSRHQPHPPGYPLYVALAKVLHAIGLSEVHALALLSILAGGLCLVVLHRLVDAMDDDEESSAWFTVPLVGLNPLFWMTTARPLSDAVGLAGALGSQWLTIAARTPGQFLMAAFLAGLLAGLRSQVVWLTVPLLLYALWRSPAAARGATALRAAGGYLAGLLLWAVPLLVVSGGPAAYWRAVSNQGAEDLTGVTLLANTFTARQLAMTLRHAFLSPWGNDVLAAVVLALAAMGAWWTMRRRPSALIVLGAAFVPYLCFDLFFQEAVTTRYALPLVVPVIYLAGRALLTIPPLAAVPLALGLVAASVGTDDGVLYSYARSEAPVFRMIGDMAVSEELPAPRVLGMHRRLEFDLRRPFQWAGSTMPAFERRLPATPKREWLELVKYWNDGNHDPVWFVADPLRSDLALIRSTGQVTRYRWGVTPHVLLGGARPDEMDLHRLTLPDWYLGEGWALTPETAGVAEEAGRGPANGGADGWFRRWSSPGTLLVGGRHLARSGTAPAEVRVFVDDALLSTFSVGPGAFIRFLEVAAAPGDGDYRRLRIESDSVDVAIEQFDVQPAGRAMYGFGEGWHELEYNPRTGVSWRWSSERATLVTRAEGHALALTLRGEIEAASSSHIVLRAGDRVLSEFDVGKSFSRTVLLPADAFASETALVVESSASYVPAATRWRSGDQRRLALKLFECRLVPAS